MESTAFSGSVPENYDRYLGPFLFEPYARDIGSRVSANDYNTVLELACGSGRVTRYLRKALPAANITATDLQPDMILLASMLLADQNIHWTVADAQELPFNDESFDLVVCQFGVMFFRDKLKAFLETYRVLKPGGKFIFNSWDKIENNAAICKGNVIICSFFAENPPTFYQVPFSFYNPDEMRTLLLAAGFKNFSFSLVKKEGVSPTAKDASIGMVQGNPVYDEDPKLLEVIRKSVEKVLSETFGDEPMRSPLQAWVVEATK